MADGARGEGNRENSASDEASLSARLRDLGKRIERQHPPDSSESRPGADTSAMARGLRLSSELVAGVLLGGAIGWLLDHWLGISPWGMIVFVLLGFAAGVLNVIRAAGVIPPNRLDPPETRE
ncbi:MAG TPA: AtpZ/AtpI family protein [Xanthobacteraceae bacterium]|jgi:ATP synthase protein I